MYEGIQRGTGPSGNATAPLKSKSGEVIIDRAKQAERWVEHYSELYSSEIVVHQSALDAIYRLPLMPDLDEQLSTEELSEEIDRLLAGKAPG